MIIQDQNAKNAKTSSLNLQTTWHPLSQRGPFAQNNSLRHSCFMISLHLRMGILTILAGTASIAIQNAEKHQQLQETLGQLQKSQQMIVRAEKLSSIGTLTAGAAHEILNPANIIGMHAFAVDS